jgi:L1 cell adhesion molecule like protein
MADVALGSVGKIIDIALKIKEAVKNVKQNEKGCCDIERCVARVTALIKRLDEVMEAMKEEVMRDALEDLAEILQGALELVTNCQRKHVVRPYMDARNMAKQLCLAQNDILRKVSNSP